MARFFASALFALALAAAIVVYGAEGDEVTNADTLIIVGAGN
jgi:hypothetical protein